MRIAIISVTRMKMKTPHIVPLSSQAIEVLELLQTISGNGALVFPGEQDANKPMSILFSTGRFVVTD